MQQVSLRSEVAITDGIVHGNRLPGPMGGSLTYRPTY